MLGEAERRWSRLVRFAADQLPNDQAELGSFMDEVGARLRALAEAPPDTLEQIERLLETLHNLDSVMEALSMRVKG